MRTIKNLSLVLMTALVAVFMTACGGGTGPEATATSFLNALQDGNFEEAKKYATANSAEVLDMMSTMADPGEDAEKPEPKKVNITETETEGDNATVTYTIEGAEEEPQTLDLTKEEGEWKVVFDKSSLGGGMNMDMEEDMEEHEGHDHEMESDTMMMEGDTGASM